MSLNLIEYLFLLLVITVASFSITPIFRKIARVAKLLDYPGGRKLQAYPVAYLGGLAVAAPITLGSFLVVFTSISIELKNQFFLGLILPSIAIAFIGLLDDIYQLPPWPKFVALCIALAAACIGFLFWNRRPASIYLGDAGSLYLGFLLAAISVRIDVNSDTEVIRVLVPLLIFAIPMIDLAQVVICRIVKGKSPFEGGRDHLSHLLLNNGVSEGKVLTLLTTSALVLALISVFLAVGN